ncbi:hypothetical protein DICSQDRAFT_168605 [Dichomitus squalens LYAD-421 SS1]|uniref:uncharacterized protein n=1 Tax=Dichomitus squalens (strain LYAD-421) TaxID=732165 RepID=UPI00044108B7|nr:uncharacterized protein DICSQDRAFT_168605 [Dichomitus squalens LYAD-421 SS1]EJF62935.1 hypothetical protein DICSQDRAFT_168605 [Dichomitus squalens LYAD-421 SS1]
MWEVERADPVTARRAANDLKTAKQHLRQGQNEQAVECFVKALDDYDNVDLVAEQARKFPDSHLAMRLLELTATKAREYLKRDLGQDCFEETFYAYGGFWGVLDTRPYMRTLHAIAHVAFDMGDLDKAIATTVETLRLCQGDNMGQRSFLPPLLLRAKRYEDALSFCQVWLDPQYDGKQRPLGGCAFAAPDPEPLSQAFVDWHTESWRPTDLLLNAALASYHLYGDCEQARQYLSLGAKGNTRIMCEIWVRSRQPTKPYSRPRTANSREESHDYLWLMQDLWMEHDVWAWATRHPDVKEAALKRCGYAECSNREEAVFTFKCCGGCKEEWYCSPECQKADWRKHKLECFGYRQKLLASSPRDKDFGSESSVSDDEDPDSLVRFAH